MREVVRETPGDHSLRRRVGLGAWLAIGALLALGAVQTSLVSASPATINAAEDGQTWIANTDSQRLAGFPAQAATCGYPDDCTTSTPAPTTPPTDTTTPVVVLPGDRTCAGTDRIESTNAPFISASDDCGADRAALVAAGCNVVETIGIGSDTFSTSDPAVTAALAAAPNGTNVAIYQLYTCGGDTVTLTTNI